MAREYVAGWLLLPTAGCSLVLDFSDRAIPVDAAADAPFTEAECAYQEPNDTLATAASIAPGDAGPAAICATSPADRDFYKLTVPASTAVSIRIAFTHRTSGDLDLRLYDRSGATPLAESHGFGDDETIACPGVSPACPALAAGDYVFEVFPGVTDAVNRYTIAIALTAM